MSGTVGIVRSDGGPVDRELLLRMVSSLGFRGPDGQDVWVDNAVGLGHAAHLIPGDGTRAWQPESLGTGTWITADVRLDARKELIAELRAHGRDAEVGCRDAQLLLHAYQAWGERCVAHITGDFSFAIWDGRRRQLFCACDHFGIRQLYFSQIDSGLVFSNTLDCVRLHPEVSDQLNDAAICDFLLFGMNYEQTTTAFAQIQRLPRAHWLRWSANGIEIREYWRPPTDKVIRYKKRTQYVEHFSDLLHKAVADRIRAKSVGILLSGGLDSSSLAAVCQETRAREASAELHAFTVTSENPLDADDRAAREVADALNIRLHRLSREASAPRDDPSLGGVLWPEPVDDPFAASVRAQSGEVARHAAVLLSGEGADNLMICEPLRHLQQLWQSGRWSEVLFGAAEHVLARFRAPDGLRGPFGRAARLVSRSSKPRFPDWLRPELFARFPLKARWANPTPRIPWKEHRQHAAAYASLFFPQWSRMFEGQSPAYTRAAVEVRYPFLDLRLVEYLLAIPALPWSFRKLLLREAMRGRLPEGIRKRRKIVGRPDRLVRALRESPFDLSKTRLSQEVGRYVVFESLGSPIGERNPEAARANLRPWCLNAWLEGLGRGPSAKPAVPSAVRQDPSPLEEKTTARR